MTALKAKPANDDTEVTFKADPPIPPDVEWTSMTRAVAQVLLGNLMLIGGVGSITFYCYLYYVASGVWTGAMVVATGLVGIMEATRTWSSNLRHSYTAMCITSMSVSLAMLAVETMAYLFDRDYCEENLHHAPVGAPYPEMPHTPTAPHQFVDSSGLNLTLTTQHAIAPTHSYPEQCVIQCVYIHSTMMALALMEFVLSVTCIYYTTFADDKRNKKKIIAAEADPIPYKHLY